ncbi:MAG: peroxidase family protein [Hyphomicrobiaceae bacterium]
MTIKLAAADLNYLLQQINIGADYSQLTSPLDPLGVREVAGSNNNLAGGFVYNADGSVTWTGNNLHGDWGQADTNFPRIFSTDTPDAPPYGVTYDPVTMQVLKDGNNQPVVDANGQPIIIPADLMTQMMESVVTAPGTSPRTITQLISSSDVDPNSPTYNPAAAAAMEALGGQPVETANSVVGTATTAKMPDPGILGGVPFNEYNVAFGQFFDHGLDFISKGGGYVLIKLSPSDPLYNDNPNPNDPFANTMMLSRAKLANPASDFDIDTLGNAVLKDGVTPQFNNNTGLLIDQSQTYGSHVSINVLVRQYDDNGIATGKLITSAEDMLPTDTGYDKALHDLGTWADMKVNAARIGIGLIDVDVLDAPAIKATATGAITFTPLHMTYNNGTEIVPALYQSNETLAAMGARTGIDLATLEAHDPFLRDADGNVLHSNQAVLADMGNGASPMGPMGNILSPMGTTDPEAVPGPGQYNEALLASHYVSGDGRVNENIGLTAVHHVFHEEHNIQVDAIKQAAIDSGTESDWQLPAVSQISTLTFAASYDVGDVVSVTVDGVTYSHTVVAGQTSGENVYDALKAVDVGGTPLAQSLAAKGVSWADDLSANTVTLTSTAGAANAFTLSAAVDNSMAVSSPWVYRVDFNNVSSNSSSFDSNDIIRITINGTNYESDGSNNGFSSPARFDDAQASLLTALTNAGYSVTPSTSQDLFDITITAPAGASISGQVVVDNTVTQNVNASVQTPGSSPTDQAAPIATTTQAAANGAWDTEKLYQAARIITESEYNHIAIDQYVGGLVVLPEFVSYSSDVNMSVSLEFSQAVFRLGHSMLNEKMQVAVADDMGNVPSTPDWTPTYKEIDLFDAFLNPALYGENGASNITMGLLNQQANNIDEFVTSALQQSLVGVGLDLPALNIARGRDVGLPTLNELRQQIFEGLQQNTNGTGSGIAPYTSWEDWGGHLRTPESLANFIAAYGRDNDTFHLQDLRVAYEDATDVSAVSHALHAYDLDGDGVIGIQDMRANGQAIVDAAADASDPMHEAALMFMRGTGSPVYNETTGTWDINNTGNGGDQGFWDIDLWIGGLAEQPLFDGPLGTTFTMVMADFGQKMQDGDRFYYLYRMPVGQHLGDQIIGEQFADLIMRTTGLEHIGDAFGYQSATFILDGTNHDNTYDGTIGVDDQYGINDYFNAIYESLPGSVQAFFLANSTLAPGALYSESTDSDATLIAGSALTVTVDLADQDNQPGQMLAIVDVVVKDAVTGDILAHQDNVLVDNGMHTTILDIPQIAYANNGHGITVEVDNHVGFGTVAVQNVTVTQSEGGGSANDGHIVVAGLEGNDYIVGALGDDYIYGDAGNDVLEGAQGNDHIYGGDGDDWITDYENDDFIHGGDGDDYINAGPGVLDTSHGGNGDDEVHGGDGVDEVFGDDGDDRLYGDGDTDLIMGGDGSDYMDGGDSVDEMFGGNGNDWMRGGVGDDNINGGSGNDLMEGGLGPTANDGDRLNGDTAPGALPVIEFNGDGTEGDMDIASYENVGFGVVANLQDANANGTSSNLLDTYSLVEGLVGSAQDDTLTGADANGTAGNGVNNYLIGGGGNDILTGLGDDAGANGPGSMDFIFGDRVIVDNDLYWIGDDRHDANNVIFTTSLAEFRAETGNKHATASDLQAALTLYANDPQAQGAWHGDGYIQNWYGTGETRVVFSADNGATVTLGHILGDHGAAGTSDTAVYHGNYNENGPSDYSIEYITMNGQQAIKITDLRDPTAIDENGNLVNPDHDGIDILVGVEFAQFANGTVKLSNDPPTLDLHADDGGFVLDNFSPSNNYAGNDGSVNWNGGWNEQGADNNGLGGNITIVNNALNFNSNALNFNSNVLNGEGVERAVDLSGATSATLSFNWSESGADNGENILVQAFNGTSWETIGTLAATSSNATGNPGIPLTAAQIGAHTAIRFEYSETGGNGFLDNNENFYIDNVRIDFTKPVNDGGATGYTAAFTEDGPAVAIAKGPAITDPDSTTMSSATIVLTNAMAGDVLAANDANGDGITATGNGTGFRGLTGATTITLTGADSLVAYQAAIERVTFSNTSSTPDETPRVINVTVFDNKGAASNVATATINVVDVPNPVANPDHVVSNNGGSTYVVPDWAFLANDSDPGGGSITVNSVTNGTGLTSVSHSNTSQTISINDNSNGSFDNTFSYDISNASQTSNSATVTVDNINGGNVTGGADADILIGNTSPNAFSGNGGNDIIIAGGGNDTISGGAGDDTIVWNVGDGRDFVDGGDSSSSLDSGTSNATGDKFMVNGNGQYYVYTRAAWLALAGNTTGQLNASTEIVISRNGTTNSNVIAELASIEDLAINTTEIVGTSSGNVSGVTVVGDFTGLLNPNTITINSVDGNIVVDISQMTSDEHVVLNTGGTYEIISNGSNTVTVNGVAEGGTAAPGDNGATDTGTPTDAAPTDGSGTPADALAVIGSGDETLVGTDGADIILGGDTTRTIHAGGGDDVVTTGDAGVVVQGGGGDDNIDGGAGRDIVFGDDGDDIISSAGGNDKVWGGVGDDVIDSGDGDDQVWGDDGDDVIDAGEGNNLVYGGAGNDDITTGSGNDRVWGDDGADLISTGDGNDRIESGLGEDVIFTGLGSDTIVFRTAAEADGDRIGDFAPGDRIDLHFMDAQESAGGNNSFALLTANAFTAEGQLIVHLDGSGNTVIEGNTDGNLATAEFKLVLDGDHVTELQQPAAIIV